MKNLSGHLTARLADKNEIYAPSLIDEINKSIHPPRPVEENEVYIRAMYIVSDEVNSQGGCFAPEELARLAQLLVDSPVMVGHKRDSLPVARNFKVEQVTDDGRQWLKSYFYWMKDSKRAQDLKNNIDGGIYKECSISFIFGLPECSVCGDDIRRCRHVPFQEYAAEDGTRKIAHFYYRHIERVLETSLVFRGAIPNTKITDALNAEIADTALEPTAEDEDFAKKPTPANVDLSSFGWARAKLVFVSKQPEMAAPIGKSAFGLPHQPGVSLRITKDGDKINIESGMLFPENVTGYIQDLACGLFDGSFIADGLLYGTRGKERINGSALARIINDPQKLHRLRLRFCDLLEFDGESLADLDYPDRVKALHERFAHREHNTIEVIPKRLFDGNEKDAISNPNSKALNYNHGFEIIISGDGRRLQRLIFTSDLRRPAVVAAIVKENRSHRVCRVNSLDESDAEFEMTVPCNVDIERGDLVAIAGDSAGSGYAFRDTLPGCGPKDIGRYDATLPADRAMIYKGRDALVIELERASDRCRILVHHFSPRLFSMARRFVADIDSNTKSRLNPENAVSARLVSYTESAGMIRLEINGRDKIFSEGAAMILRPALIDGEKRYLCFRDNINSCQVAASGAG